MGKKKYITMGIIFVMVEIGFYQIPPLINYQGMLRDASGNSINGTVSVVFRIYDVATGGTALWEETQGVTVLNGLFNVLLGSVNPISLDLFSGSERYLGLTVGSDAEMVPRKRLVSMV